MSAFSFAAAAEPKIAKATTKGPIVVPKLLIPPPLSDAENLFVLVQ